MVDEGDALREVVAQKSVRVLVRTALLRRSGVAKVDGCAELVAGGRSCMRATRAAPRESESLRGRCTNGGSRVWRSTKVPIAERWLLPMMRSSSVLPASDRSTARKAGRGSSASAVETVAAGAAGTGAPGGDPNPCAAVNVDARPTARARSAISMRSSWDRNRARVWRTASRSRGGINPTAVGLLAACPVRRCGPGHTAFPGRGAHAPPASPQLHEPLTFGRLRTPPRPRFGPSSTSGVLSASGQDCRGQDHAQTRAGERPSER